MFALVCCRNEFLHLCFYVVVNRNFTLGRNFTICDRIRNIVFSGGSFAWRLGQLRPALGCPPACVKLLNLCVSSLVSERLDELILRPLLPRVCGL